MAALCVLPTGADGAAVSLGGARILSPLRMAPIPLQAPLSRRTGLPSAAVRLSAGVGSLAAVVPAEHSINLPSSEIADLAPLNVAPAGDEFPAADCKDYGPALRDMTLRQAGFKEGTAFDHASAAGLGDAVSAGTPLEIAKSKLYGIAGSHPASGSARAARLTTAQRTAYFRSPEFRGWVASEKKAGRRVFWLKDLDKTQARGDIFTFFFKWRADNGKLTEEQNQIMKDYLKTVSLSDKSLRADLSRASSNDAKANAALVLKLWRSKEEGGDGIGLIDFWREVYWPTQKGLSKKEKLAQVNAFSPHYASRIYPGVKEENLALRRAGVDVVIVSNGDQELAQGIEHLLGIKTRNVVGSHLIYKRKGRDMVSTGVNHAYEIFDKDWHSKPQPGKSLSFHYWLNANKWRWGWSDVELGQVVVAGVDGDSASSDGGMMTLLPPGAALGNFMIDTPQEPDRLKKFQELAEKYGWTKGEFIALEQDPAFPGAWTADE